MIFSESGYNCVPAEFFDNYRCNPYVYFLINEDNEVLYVGCSKRINERCKQHKSNSNIPFSHVIFIECNENNYRYYEKEMIMKYRPKYNKKIEWNPPAVEDIKLTERESYYLSKSLEKVDVLEGEMNLYSTLKNKIERFLEEKRSHNIVKEIAADKKSEDLKNE